MKKSGLGEYLQLNLRHFWELQPILMEQRFFWTLLGHPDQCAKGQVDERKKVWPRVQTMLLCKRNAIQKSFFPKLVPLVKKLKKIQEKHFRSLGWSFCHFSYFILTIWQPKKMSKQDIFGRKGAVQCWFLVRFRLIFESQVRPIN